MQLGMTSLHQLTLSSALQIFTSYLTEEPPLRPRTIQIRQPSPLSNPLCLFWRGVLYNVWMTQLICQCCRLLICCLNCEDTLVSKETTPAIFLYMLAFDIVLNVPGQNIRGSSTDRQSRIKKCLDKNQKLKIIKQCCIKDVSKNKYYNTVVLFALRCCNLIS